jgi:hypothetical protein
MDEWFNISIDLWMNGSMESLDAMVFMDSMDSMD